MRIRMVLLLTLGVLVLNAAGSLATIEPSHIIAGYATAKKPAEPMLINQIVTDPSEILSTEELQSILESYEGEAVDIDTLQKVVEEINQLYSEKGFITAKALLPPQDVEDGVVYIQLVEGRLGRLLLEGNSSTSDRFIQGRISLESEDIIKLDLLEQDILYLNKTSDVNLRGELSAGESFGKTDVMLIVSEPSLSQAVFFLDNAGRSETSSYRWGTTLVNRSVFGYRDPLTISAVQGEGSLSGSISYNWPLSRSGTRLGTSYDLSSVNVISGEFETVEIAAHSSGLSVFLTHPMVVEAPRVVEGFMEWHQRKSRTFFSSHQLLESKSTSTVMGLTMETIGSRQHTNSVSSVTFGVNDAGVDQDFMKLNWYYNSHYVQENDNQFIHRLALQWSASRLLPPAEQFAVGGMATVRGYAEGLLTGDSGYLISMEYKTTVSDRLIGMLFFDHGAAFPYKGNEEPITYEDFLTSIGASATIRFTDNVSGQLVLGLPLTGTRSIRVHFSTQSVF